MAKSSRWQRWQDAFRRWVYLAFFHSMAEQAAAKEEWERELRRREHAEFHREGILHGHNE